MSQPDYSEIARARGIPIVRVGQENTSRWHWTIYNTEGGSFGMSDSGSSRKRAIALRVPEPAGIYCMFCGGKKPSIDAPCPNDNAAWPHPKRAA